MDTFLLIILVFAIGPIIIIGIIVGVLAMGNKDGKEYRPYKETPDEVLISEYKRIAKRLGELGTRKISSWLEQQSVQDLVDTLEKKLTLYGDELEARGYKIDLSNPKGIKIWKD